MEKNKFNFAKLMILSYAEDLWVCVSDLNSENLEQMMNMESHGLSENELILVLQELFNSKMLVANSKNRGLFSPNLSEIEMALNERKDPSKIDNNTFYGLTSGCYDLFKKLKSAYGRV